MKIEDLDEAQGLTAEMVRDWLRQQEPRIKRTTNVMTSAGMGDVWTWPSGDTVRDAKMDAWLSSRVKDIALIEGRTVQSLLRDINPRMRANPDSRMPFPSLPALKASAWWIIEVEPFGLDPTAPDVQTHLLVMPSTFMRAVKFRTCWPCDAHGNKIRWPERDGVML